jgi:hypothetical protein
MIEISIIIAGLKSSHFPCLFKLQYSLLDLLVGKHCIIKEIIININIILSYGLINKF